MVNFAWVNVGDYTAGVYDFQGGGNHINGRYYTGTARMLAFYMEHGGRPREYTTAFGDSGVIYFNSVDETLR